jgi:hypothetical protein
MRPSSFRAALAALLVLAQLLAPFAHRPAAAAAWLDVCTGDGLRRVPAGDEPEAPRHEADHCVLCRLASSPSGAPPAVLVAVAAPARHAATSPPVAVGSGAPNRHDAPARAPPVVG